MAVGQLIKQYQARGEGCASPEGLTHRGQTSSLVCQWALRKGRKALNKYKRRDRLVNDMETTKKGGSEYG